jgi:hypothetical protein
MDLTVTGLLDKQRHQELHREACKPDQNFESTDAP